MEGNYWWWHWSYILLLPIHSFPYQLVGCKKRSEVENIDTGVAQVFQVQVYHVSIDHCTRTITSSWNWDTLRCGWVGVLRAMPFFGFRLVSFDILSIWRSAALCIGCGPNRARYGCLLLLRDLQMNLFIHVASFCVTLAEAPWEFLIFSSWLDKAWQADETPGGAGKEGLALWVKYYAL